MAPKLTHGSTTGKLVIDASGVSTLALDDMRADLPLTLNVKNSDRLIVQHSEFSRIPWPGFFIFNVTDVFVKANNFVKVAPRSFVVKNGA